MKYLIGLDVGTSGAKCIMIDETGKVVASSTQEYPLYTPKPGWAEQNPQDWWDAVVRGLRVILQKAAAVGLDCTAEIEMMRKSYEDRRNLFFEKLNAIDGVEAKSPEGAFYAWVKIDKKDMDSFQIANYLLEEALVVGVPGEAYGKGGAKCVRFSFATALDQLLEAADRMKAALDKL